MDFVKLKKRIIEVFGKYKYVGLVLLTGIFLMVLPTKDTDTEPEIEKQEMMETEDVDIEEKLENILCCVQGAGHVKVMLTISKGTSSVYQTDSSYSQNEGNTDSRTQTVLVTDSNRNEGGLIYQINPPIYQGAIVLTQGADDPEVKLAIVEAVSDVTGLGADKISVLKMQ